MEAEPGQSERIAIALSGGGFRATLFHLGVLLFLRDSGLLSRVTHVASVSGGSIASAYVLSRLEDFGDDERHFDVVQELTAFTQSDLVGKIYRGFVRRTAKLQTLYNRGLFGDAKLATLRRDGAPKLYVMATNLTTGEPLAFSPEGLYLGSAVAHGAPVAASVDIARAVAASSAFPVLFPALELTRKELGLTGAEMTLARLRVTDGGVRDNSGLEFLHRLRAESATLPFDILISIDARRCFDLSDAGEKRPFGLGMLPVLDRAFEIATFQLDNYREVETGARVVRLTDASPANSMVGDEVRRRLRFLRTDFDRFSDEEIFALLGHGYEAAAAKLVDLVRDPANTFTRDWERTLGAPVPALSTVAFERSAHNRLARHFLVPGALLMLSAVLLASGWAFLQRPRIPEYSEQALRSQSAVDAREGWMRAVLNDLEREVRASTGKPPVIIGGQKSSDVVAIGVLRWGPVSKRAPPAVLTAKYDAEKYDVSALGFLCVPFAGSESCAPLKVAVSNGRVAIHFADARPGDTFVLAMAAMTKGDETPPQDVANLLSDWRFHE